MEKAFQVKMIDTTEKSRFGFLTTKGKEVFKDLRFFETELPTILDSQNQFLVFYSNEMIERGDAILDLETNDFFYYFNNIILTDKIKKVSMISLKIFVSEKVKLISNDLIEEFVEEWKKNNEIKEVTISTKFN